MDPMTERGLLAAALAQESRHAVIVLDAAGRVVEWSPAACVVFGYAPKEMVGETLDRLLLPEDLRHGEARWALDAARSYGQIDDDRWMRRGNGEKLWICSTTTALREDNEIVGFVRVCRDRTDLQMHVETLQARLEKALLAERDMQATLATLAHELRGPLADIAANARIARQMADGDARRERSAASIERQVAFADRLVRDLLESTRAAMGKARLQIAPVDVKALLDDAIGTCGEQVAARGQLVEVELGTGSLEAHIDGARMKQVLVNLLDNASKFSPKQARIRVCARAEGADLVVRVRDGGRGITAQQLPTIFERFAQAPGDGEGSGQGLGLGLSVVKTIVDMHGGSVAVASEGQGRGTEVTVHVPL